MSDSKKYIVTGGGGFVGKAISKSLLADGHEVHSVARGHYPELEELGIHSHRVDLGQSSRSLEEIFFGAEAVFHVAAKVDMWGRYEDFRQANVEGTKNVIDACKKAGVRKLVFTSSPSVVADGSDLNGVDESYPYPKHFEAFYPQTKAEAEKLVLAASSDSLFTCALRPHLIWGPGDTNLIPTILEKAKSGKLMQVGSGQNKTDLCYIEDCVRAHLLAEKALDSNPKTRGRAFFISQGEPVNMWLWINEVLERHGMARIEKKVPTRLAMGIAAVLEGICKLLPSNPEPRLTRFLVSEMATSHYFDISAAERELGFKPKYSIDQAMKLCFDEKSVSVNG